MIVVKVEVWPWGDEEQKYTLHTMTISNVTPTGYIADYRVQCDEEETKVRGHDRHKGAWELVRRAVTAYLESRGVCVNSR